VKMADAWLTPQPAIPPQVLDNLAAAGVPKDLIDTALGMAKRQTSEPGAAAGSAAAAAALRVSRR
jgi:hypothetical protein